MQTVTFPGLNLILNINRTAFTIFGISIYWYGILMVTAMVIATAIYKKRDGLYQIKFKDILDLLIYLIPISLISARAYYVLFNLKFYMENPSQILNFRNGGMAIYGGVIGGIITCYLFCKKRKINFLDLIDYLAPGLVLGQSIGRWGNFINVEAYGTKTNLPWRMGIYNLGEYIEVHPTFLYESLACFIIFIILIQIKNKRFFKGQIACTYLLLYSLERTFVEALRTDSLMLGNIRISQLLSIIILVICVIIYVGAGLVSARKIKNVKLFIYLPKKCRKSTQNINKEG